MTEEPSVLMRVCLIMQFYEVDLPHASNIKQKLVQKVLPDTDKVSQVVPLIPVLIRKLLPYVIAQVYCLQIYDVCAWPLTEATAPIAGCKQKEPHAVTYIN